MARVRSTRSVDEIDGELVELRQGRRDYARANNRRFAEDAVADAERAIAEAQARLDALAAQWGFSGFVPFGHPESMAYAEAAARVLTGDHLRTQAGLVAGALDGPAKGEVEGQLAEFDTRIAGLEQERREAEKAARIAELEREYA